MTFLGSIGISIEILKYKNMYPTQSPSRSRSTSPSPSPSFAPSIQRYDSLYGPIGHRQRYDSQYDSISPWNDDKSRIFNNIDFDIVRPVIVAIIFLGIGFAIYLYGVQEKPSVSTEKSSSFSDKSNSFKSNSSIDDANKLKVCEEAKRLKCE